VAHFAGNSQLRSIMFTICFANRFVAIGSSSGGIRRGGCPAKN